jgi:hypothetical protein
MISFISMPYITDNNCSLKNSQYFYVMTIFVASMISSIPIPSYTNEHAIVSQKINK